MRNGYDIPRYLMVTCQVCTAIKTADRPCHYCGAWFNHAGTYVNRAGRAIARAAGNTIAAKIRRVADKLGVVAA